MKATDTTIPCSRWHESPQRVRSGFDAQLMEIGEDWRYPLHRHHGFCEFVYVRTGQLAQTINGQQCKQAAGEVILIRDNDQHSLEGSLMTYVNIMFPLDWLRRLDDFLQVRDLGNGLLLASASPRAVIPDTEREAYEGMVDGLFENPASEVGRRMFARFLLTTVSRYLSPMTAARVPSDLPDWLRDTVEWINQRRRRPPALAEVIQRAGRCQEHVTRAFTKYLEAPPTRYLAALRVDRAAELLVTTNATVSQVGFECGFENLSYFHRLFKQRKNMSPLAYRRAHGPRSVRTR